MKNIIILFAISFTCLRMESQDLTLNANNSLLGNDGSGTFTQLIFWTGSNVYYGRNALGAGVDNQYFRTNGIDRMMISYVGNIDIGTTSPTSKFFIKQNHENSNGGLSISDLSGRLIQIYGEGSGGRQVIGTSSTANPLAFDMNGEEKMRLTSGGSLGIGTTNPGSYKLAVKGKIRAEEIKVETGWADYVFKEGYDLPTLEEVEKHIKEKGHLINIPSAKEVEENGIELGEMNKLLLEKIEELMLYTIEQQKELQGQREQIIDLKLELKTQNNEIEELKALMINRQK